jgi:phospholipid/cholesterol/gamma-HCH transport system ATP-binding protein
LDVDARAAVRIEELTIGYGAESVLEDVSLEVRRGEVFIIAGASGCGKTTLLKAVLGLIPYEKGTVTIANERLTGADLDTAGRLLRSIGVAFQESALLSSLTLLENVMLPVQQHTDLPGDAIRMTAMMKLGLVDLADAAAKLPAEVSGGMQKRAAIARALALNASIVFLDEPHIGFDPIGKAELDALILRLVRSLEVTFVVISHELSSIYTIADRVALIDADRKGIAAIGTPTALRDEAEDPWVRRFFDPQGIFAGIGAKASGRRLSSDPSEGSPHARREGEA